MSLPLSTNKFKVYLTGTTVEVWDLNANTCLGIYPQGVLSLERDEQMPKTTAALKITSLNADFPFKAEVKTIARATFANFYNSAGTRCL